MQAYSDPSRESDEHALPDIEVFEATEADLSDDGWGDLRLEPGWYYWYCFPGCLPDSEAVGPFASAAEAEAAAQEDAAA